MGSCKNKGFDSSFLRSLNPLSLQKSVFSSQSKEPNNALPNPDNHRTIILREENKIEREIINAILSGKPESLKPNSGQAIPIGDNYVCVSFHEEIESDCKVWEWHGHVVYYSEENGYTQEYIYGNYFERMMRQAFCYESDEEIEETGFGLTEFIGGLNLTDGRVFCRNTSEDSSRF